MKRTHVWIKIKALDKGISLKNIAEGVGIEYNYFIQIVNAFKNTPGDFVEKVKGYLEGLE
jgi:hypothetical protein